MKKMMFAMAAAALAVGCVTKDPYDIRPEGEDDGVPTAVAWQNANDAALEAAIDVFRTHKVSKVYHAVVAGSFKFAHQIIETPIDNRPAVSKVTREAASAEASFLRVRIETGRTNQIRRHLAGVRYPIVGDRTFGLKSARDPRLMTVPRQMLHATALALPDPMRKGEEIKAHSPLPADFRSALKLFGMGKR